MTMLQHTSSFERTLQDFKKDLTDDQLQDFTHTTLKDLQLVISAIQKKQCMTRTYQNLRRIEGFLEAMESNAKVIEVFLNVNSFVGLIWGPMKFLLQTASNFAEAFNAVLDAYQRIGEHMPLLAHYQDLFDTNPEMRRILELYYQDIFDFHLRAIKYFKCSVWRQMFQATWKQFDARFKHILENMRQHKVLIERKASLIEFEQAKTARDLAEEQFKDLEEQEMLRRKAYLATWLAAADVTSEQEVGRLARQHHPQSGRWLLTKPIVRTWLENRAYTNQSLWLHGRPGSGKSVLASMIVDELETRPGVNVVYFYCRYDDPQKRTFVAMARCFLQQFLQIGGTLVSRLYESATSEGSASLASRKTAETLIDMSMRAAGQVFIIVDGIDECPAVEQKLIGSWLRKYVESTSLDPDPSRCLFVSQQDETTVSLFSGLPIIALVPADNKHDIWTYCHTRVACFPADLGLTAAKATSVASTVAQRADGMFLFARLVMDNLSQQASISDLQEEMNPAVLPQGLDEAYKRIADRIIAQAHPRRRHNALQLLAWIACAIRPLQWREIRAATAIDFDRTEVDFANRAWKVDHTALCGPFVEMQPNGTLHLVHPTARMYLEAAQHVVPAIEHARLATACLSYLCFPCFDPDLNAPKRQQHALNGSYAFGDYAFVAWPNHLMDSCLHRNGMLLEDDHISQHTFEELEETLDLFFDLYWQPPRKKSKPPKRVTACVQNFPEEQREKLLLTLAAMHTLTRHEATDTSSLVTLKLSKVFFGIREQLEILVREKIHESTLNEYYGKRLFRCSRLYCEAFHEGFLGEDERTDHVRKHERAHLCHIPGCPYTTIGCKTASELEAHIQTFHNPLSAPKDTDFETVSQKEDTTEEVVDAPLDNKPFACVNCNKRFARRSNLNAHKRTHTDNRPFECQTCRKTFGRQHDLNVHARQHTKVKNMMTCRGILDSGLPWGCGNSFDGPTKLVRHFWTKAGRNCVKGLWDQEAERPRQFAAASIPPLKEMLNGEDIEQSLPPMITDHIPDLAGIDIQEAFRAEGAPDGTTSGYSAITDSSTPPSRVDNRQSSTKRAFGESASQAIPRMLGGADDAVSSDQSQSTDVSKRRRLSL